MRRTDRKPSRKTAAALTAVLIGAGALTGPATAADRPADTSADTSADASARLDDGLALTPPMGFNNWNSTHCRPEFDEEMIKGVADIIVETGLKDAGYEYVNLDDCWALPERDADGKLVPDPERFPSGIAALADYVHAKGLKFGIYTSAGTMTCANDMPGALGHEYSDAQQFADWGVDYLKYDNCNNQGVDAIERYTTMRDALAATGRPIVYSICEWGQNDPWTWGADVGHLWRTTGDISDNWPSVLSIFEANVRLAEYAGPGHWNDPDMLEVGNGGMTATEYRSHFSLWSIMAAPLLIGTDLRVATDETIDILGNREVIAVDQDPLGRQATVVSSEGGRWVLTKKMSDGSRAVALFNASDTAQRIETTAAAAGLPEAPGYRMRDLWQHTTSHTAGTIAATVPAHGTALYRVRPDDGWAAYPPAVEVGATGIADAEAGTTSEVTASATNLGGTPARSVSLTITGPDGWDIQPTTATRAPRLRPGETLTTRWTLRIPEDTPPDTYEITVSATHRPSAHTTTTFTTHVLQPPPAGTSHISDLPWTREANGWGPVERDTSVGESAAGDGRPLTVGGTTYAKGLGAHAPSTVAFYAGERCTDLTAYVGVDDEVPESAGTVAFEVWADGTLLASTPTLTGADGPHPLTADVTGARHVELVVTDGGDGITSDHADWADATISCAA
ncbi:NPCBM/NEW2 domain-containing protein [Streptomyces sp. 6N223]|uniref:NPCBM/NEW2 domain-containing protein n=1 Tax=Streptomyces sp. 6N223 TaxID=3457412 RepID=UPI003FD62F92